MAIATARILASGCAAVLVFSSAVGARAAEVVVAKHENLEHYTVNGTSGPTASFSPFFTSHIGGATPFLPSNGWAPLLTEAQPAVQAGTPGATSTTPKKTFNFVGNSTAAGNWADGNGIPAGITLSFDAELTIKAMSLTPGDAPFLTVPGQSNENASGRGIGVTSVLNGADDINFVPQRGLAFSPVTVSNVSFTGTLAEAGFTFTPGGVSGFGVELFASGVFNENLRGMLLTQGEDGVQDPGEGTIGFGGNSGLPFQTGTIASYQLQNLNFGPYSPGPAGGSANPPDPSSVFPRQSGPFTLVTSASDSPSGGGTIRGFTLGYDVTYDISAAGISPPGDYNNNGSVDAADYVVWKKAEGTNTDLPNDGTLTGTVGAGHYNLWRANFGQPSGSGAGSVAEAGVPEPATVVMLLIGGVIVALSRRRTMVS